MDQPSKDQAQLASKWLTAKEAAIYLRVETRTILDWARNRKVKAYALSGTKRVTWRFLATDLDAMLRMPAVAGR